MTEEIGGNNIRYYSVDDFILNTKYVIHEVSAFNRLTTKNNTCNNCKGKLIKKDKDLLIFEKYYTDYRFEFREYCTCCGAHFFKKGINLLYVIDEISINHRKAKINRLKEITK